jgi:Zn-dependent protease with chaperone function
MNYCVNCGSSYERPSGICSICYSEQLIPNEIIELELSRNKNIPPSPHNPMFSFPGEKAALTLSICISIIIAIILGTVSFGLFFAILLMNLIYLKISHISSQKNMFRSSEDSFKTIFKLGKVGAYRLKIPLPEIYITQDDEYNAYTKGFYKYGFIVLNSSMVNDFTPEELLFVIGHEMGHMKKYHTTWLNLTNPARSGGAKFIFAPVMRYIFNIWSVKAEYTADQGGLIACKSLRSAVTAFLKMAGGHNIKDQIDINKIMQPGDQNDQIFSSFLEYFGTHPFIENRIKQLINLSTEKSS